LGDLIAADGEVRDIFNLNESAVQNVDISNFDFSAINWENQV